MTTRSDERVLEVDDRLERLVLDVDRLDGVAGGGVAGGEHGGDAVADVADLVRRPAGSAAGFFMSSVTGQAHGIGAAHGVGEVGAGVHGDDAGQRSAAATCRC